MEDLLLHYYSFAAQQQSPLVSRNGGAVKDPTGWYAVICSSSAGGDSRVDLTSRKHLPAGGWQWPKHSQAERYLTKALGAQRQIGGLFTVPIPRGTHLDVFWYNYTSWLGQEPTIVLVGFQVGVGTRTMLCRVGAFLDFFAKQRLFFFCEPAVVLRYMVLVLVTGRHNRCQSFVGPAPSRAFLALLNLWALRTP